MKTIIFCVTVLVTFLAGMAISASLTTSFDEDSTPAIIPKGNYIVHQEHVIWNEARRKCRNQNSTLVEIYLDSQLTDIKKELLSNDLDSAWVGGRGAQPGEYPSCGFFWNEEGEEITIPVKNKTNTQCIPGSDRTHLRVEVIVSVGQVGLMARHQSSILPYICELDG